VISIVELLVHLIIEAGQHPFIISIAGLLVQSHTTLRHPIKIATELAKGNCRGALSLNFDNDDEFLLL
jgi:hypothetical protein